MCILIAAMIRRIKAELFLDSIHAVFCLSCCHGYLVVHCTTLSIFSCVYNGTPDRLLLGYLAMRAIKTAPDTAVYTLRYLFRGLCVCIYHTVVQHSCAGATVPLLPDLISYNTVAHVHLLYI